MNRRGFIKGLLVSASAGTALVKLASAEETRELAPSEPVLIGQPQRLGMPLPTGDGLVYMKNPHGEYFPVGYITSVKITHARELAHSWSGDVIFVPGLTTVRATFEGRLD